MKISTCTKICILAMLHCSDSADISKVPKMNYEKVQLNRFTALREICLTVHESKVLEMSANFVPKCTAIQNRWSQLNRIDFAQLYNIAMINEFSPEADRGAISQSLAKIWLTLCNCILILKSTNLVRICTFVLYHHKSIKTSRRIYLNYEKRLLAVRVL